MKNILSYRNYRILALSSVKLIGALLLFLADTAYATTFFVKPPSIGGSDVNSGLSWSSAKATINAAIDSTGNGDQVWVAKGTYTEHVVIDEVVADAVKNVALYGGFIGDGSETELNQRNIVGNETIIDGSGTGTVVSIGTEEIGPRGASDQTRIDGFSIINGRPSGLHLDGGGIRIWLSAPVIVNNTIQNNDSSGGLGGGIFIDGPRSVGDGSYQHPQISRNKIIENRARGMFGNGGGIALFNSNATITFNTFERNQASRNGGGIAILIHNLASGNTASPKILNNLIIGNTSGALNPWQLNTLEWGELDDPSHAGGGGLYAAATDETGVGAPYAKVAPVIANNVIAANGAFEGGGVHLQATKSTSATPIRLVNNTIVANSGSGVYWQGAVLSLDNNIVAFNSVGLHLGEDLYDPTDATLSHNNVFGNVLLRENTDFIGLGNAIGTNGNISADPGFADYRTGDLHISPGSPCVNAGIAVTGVWPENWYDAEYDPRMIDDVIDIGADEAGGTAPTEADVVFVTPSGSDMDNGLSWGTANASLNGAIAHFDAMLGAIGYMGARGGEIWVAGGGAEPYTGAVTVPAFVHVYAGFAGTESALEERDWLLNETILDGGRVPSVVRFGNAGYRVSRLDGFIIQRGGGYVDLLPTDWSEPLDNEDLIRISQNDYTIGQGGGLLAWISGPEIAHNTIRYNAVGDPNALGPDGLLQHAGGGGIAGYLSTAVIADNRLHDNQVWDSTNGAGGGAIYFRYSFPLIEGNLIERNHAEEGSAILLAGNFTSALPDPNMIVPYANARVAGNRLESNWQYYVSGSGLVSESGAVKISGCESTSITQNIFRHNLAKMGGGIHLINCNRAHIESNLFADNHSANIESGYLFFGGGGGMYAQLLMAPTGVLRIVNNTFVENTAVEDMFSGGGAILLELMSSGIELSNNVIAFNSSGIMRSMFSLSSTVPRYANMLFNGSMNYVNLTPDPSDIIADPLFIDQVAGDYRLGESSPGVETGSLLMLPEDGLDLAGAARIQDADYDLVFQVDIGAYEFSPDYDGDGDPDWSDPDDDNDGLSDDYENSYAFLDPLDPADAGQDFDGDGFTNLEEFQIGSNPDDLASNPGMVSFSDSAYIVNELGGTASFPVNRTLGAWGAISVRCYTSSPWDGATPELDYSHTDQLLSWADGDVATKNCQVPILNDMLYDLEEDFLVDLIDPVGTHLEVPDSATVTIKPYLADNDFTRDNLADLLWWNPTNRATILGITQPDFTTERQVVGISREGYDLVGVGDFDADGDTDILLYRPTDGVTAQYTMEAGVDTFVPLGISGVGLQVGAIGDVDADGDDDVLWYDPSTGNALLWKFDPVTKPKPTDLGAFFRTGYEMKGAGDIDGDGDADILWYRPTDGSTFAWFMQYGAVADQRLLGSLPTNLHIAGVGDTDADGDDDILWYDPTLGQVRTWFMQDGVRTQVSITGRINPAFDLVSVIDMDGDGDKDLVFRNPEFGNVHWWPMEDGLKTERLVLGSMNPAFQLIR